MGKVKESANWRPGVSGHNVRLSLDSGYLRAPEPADADDPSRPLGRRETTPDYVPHVPLYLMDPYPEQPIVNEAQGEQ